MSKAIASLFITIGAIAATGLARAEGADGPSYPALQAFQSVSTRAEVQARQAGGHDGYGHASADGATYPALQASAASSAGRGEVNGDKARIVAGGAAIEIGNDRYGA